MEDTSLSAPSRRKRSLLRQYLVISSPTLHGRYWVLIQRWKKHLYRISI